MAKEKIDFIIRAKSGYNAACRCINSVLRQKTPDYNIFAYVYNKADLEKLEEEYPDIKLELVKNDKGYAKKFNLRVKESDAKYCIMLDGDGLVTPDIVENILKYEEDTVIFNIAKLNDNGRFKLFYANKSLENEANYIKKIQSVWAVAVNPAMLREKNIKLKGLDYSNQALYLLMCMSLAKKVAFTARCLVYKMTVIGDKEITAEFFQKNRNDITRAIKAFASSGRNKAKAQVIRIFMINEIEESFELPLMQKIKKIWSFVKTIWF